MMNGHVERHTSVSVSGDASGAIRRTVVEETVISVDDDASTSTAPGTDTDGCFDIDTCCDAREKAMIEALRAYLRPVNAPECLIERLHRCIQSAAQEGAAHPGPQR
ncbi:hypothetical protein KIH77_00865 [Bifidobacterium sp. 82T24]|uniref:hypothetical protein n=1 Tax=Bifidobacterium pluvialisilvae TaxID=2834436 RepID=UPI001C569F02|nr:hypothetical protein [Bifidobacterium pluvialisilvae]MBW3087297.1 hypothetical protein [Bifidobacterium pluvialisilvae]